MLLQQCVVLHNQQRNQQGVTAPYMLRPVHTEMITWKVYGALRYDVHDKLNQYATEEKSETVNVKFQKNKCCNEMN